MANNSGWEDINPSQNQTPAAASSGEWEDIVPDETFDRRNEIQQSIANPAPPTAPRGFFERAKDSYKEAVLYGFPGIIGRKFHDWTNTGMDLIKQKYPNATPEEQEAMQEKLIALTQRDLRDQYAKKREEDPTWRPDEGWFDNLASGRWLPFLAGQVAGSPGPESFFLPGGSAAGRIGWQGVTGGVSESAYQGADIMDNVQDEFDPVQSLAAAGAAMGFQGVFEALGKGVNMLRGRKGGGPDVEGPRELIEGERSPLSDETYAQEINDALSGGADRNFLNQINERYGKEPFGPELDEFLKDGTRTRQATPDGGMISRSVRTPEEQELVDAAISKVSEAFGITGERLERALTEPDFQNSVRLEIAEMGGNPGIFNKDAPLGTRERLTNLGTGEEGPEVTIYTPGELEKRINTKLIELEEADAQSAVPMSQPEPEAPMAATPPGERSEALVQIRKLANDIHMDAEIEGGKYTIGQIGAIHKQVSEGVNSGKFQGADLEEAQNILAFLEEAAVFHDQAIRARDADTGIAEQGPPPVEPLDPNVGAGNVRPIPANENVGNQLVPTEAERGILGDNPSNADLEKHRGVRVNPRTGEVEILPKGDGGSGPPREPPSGDGNGGDGEPPIDPEELVQRLTQSLKAADKASKETKALRTEERRKRLKEVAKVRQFTSGRQGYYAEKAQLAGELPRADLEPIEGNFTPREIDVLFDIVKEKDDMYGNTRASLIKLLGGEIPSKRELDLLSKVFPNDFIKEVMKKRSRGEKILDFTTNAINLPRSLMATFDLSFPLRQGIALIGRKEFWKNWTTMFKVFGSERAYNAVMADIEARPTFKLMEEAGVAFTHQGHDFTKREEQFMSQWAEKIPVLGRGVRASERAFTGFGNKLRADVFDSILDLYAKAGRDISEDPKALKDIAWFVNNATGRGDLGRFNQAAPILNGLFFSPRLMASRVNMLRPDNYIRLDPIVRQEAIKSMLSFGGIALTVASLAQMGGMEVEGDPRSSDFAKLKTGDTRYDILGGFGQYLTLGARLYTNETKRLNDDIEELGQKYGSDTRLDVLLKFLQNKESPVASFVTDYLRGKDPVGEPFEMKEAIAKRFIPLFLQDIKEMTDEYGSIGALMAAPGVFGVGVQNYSNPKTRDMFGRDETDETAPKDEVDLEVERLSAPLKGELIGRVKKSIYVGKDENDENLYRKLTDEEYDQYQYLSGQMILESIRQEMNTPEWKLMSDNEKRDVIRDIAKDMRKQAREDLFTPKTQEETEGWSDL